MTKEINVSNLSDSIRFYSSLFNQRPGLISFDYATFRHGDFEIRLFENADYVRQNPKASVLVVKEDHFKNLFKMKLGTRHKSVGLECQLLEDRFKAQDPDGMEWIITTSPINQDQLVTEANVNYCYLQPINF